MEDSKSSLEGKTFQEVQNKVRDYKDSKCKIKNDQQIAPQEAEAAEAKAEEDADAQVLLRKMQVEDETKAITVEIQMLSGSVLATLTLPPDAAVIEVREWLRMHGSEQTALLKDMLRGGASLVTAIGVCDEAVSEAGKMLLGDLKDEDRKVVLTVVLHPVPFAGETFHCREICGELDDMITVSFDEKGHNAHVQWDVGWQSATDACISLIGEMEMEVRWVLPKVKLKKKRGKKAYHVTTNGGQCSGYHFPTPYCSDTDEISYISGVIEMEAEYNRDTGLKFEDLPRIMQSDTHVFSSGLKSVSVVRGPPCTVKKWVKRTDTKPGWTFKEALGL